jgi:hypothetical protein
MSKLRLDCRRDVNRRLYSTSKCPRQCGYRYFSGTLTFDDPDVADVAESPYSRSASRCGTPYEVRKEANYFDDILDEKIPKDMLRAFTGKFMPWSETATAAESSSSSSSFLMPPIRPAPRSS